MARKNIEVTVVGGLSTRVPAAPITETPAAPQAVPEPVTEQEETKPSRKGRGKGNG